MKIAFDKQVELIAEGYGTLDVGERPPFVQVDLEKIYTETIEEEEVQVFADIATRGYCRELNGLTYYLINSYGNIGTISGVPSGAVSWTKGQVPTEVIQYHTDLFGVENTIMYEDFIEQKGIELMWDTLDGAKSVATSQIEDYFDTMGGLGFYSEARGELEHFDSDEYSTNMVMGQYAVSLGNEIKSLKGLDETPLDLRWKVEGQMVCEPWTTEQVTKLGEDLQQAIQFMTYQKELLLESIDSCESIEDVKLVLASLAQ